MSISTSLLRAAKLQEKIEQMREELAGLLDKARAELVSAPVEEVAATPRRRRRKMKKLAPGKPAATTKAPTTRISKPAKPDGRTKAARALKAGRKSPLKGIKRATSPSGPLAPAVVKVLESKKQPMNVRDILDGLVANGYHFNSPEPKKNLAARIYRLNGVKQVSAGLFAVV